MVIQELIASESVVFFYRNWHELGDKSGLVHTLGTIRGTDHETPLGVPIQCLIITHRLLRMSERATARPEDSGTMAATVWMGRVNLSVP
ncbi:hypothetical protein K449DRAFT_431503 [Hypoxylon sp. EC38]|nr:hypothetical protein K449DRAFT_431503 [Hypoxylon sp. EC38]